MSRREFAGNEDISDRELAEWLESVPPVEESLRKLAEDSIDLDRDPEFVTSYNMGMFVEGIYAAMEAQGLSQSDLAERLGMSRQRISRMLNETSERNFTIRTMARIACALGCELTVRMTLPAETVNLAASRKVAIPVISMAAGVRGGGRRAQHHAA